jgi:hypothetical protein
LKFGTKKDVSQEEMSPAEKVMADKALAKEATEMEFTPANMKALAQEQFNKRLPEVFERFRKNVAQYASQGFLWVTFSGFTDKDVYKYPVMNEFVKLGFVLVDDKDGFTVYLDPQAPFRPDSSNNEYVCEFNEDTANNK